MKQNSKIENYSSFSNLMVLDRMNINSPISLVKPSQAIKNESRDNVEDDLVVYKDQIISDSERKSDYVIQLKLGKGSYGNVFLASNNYSLCALKIIKSHPSYFRQAKIEIQTIDQLKGIENVLQMISYFTYYNHLIIITPVYGQNLLELITTNYKNGLPFNIVKVYIKQLLRVLTVLDSFSIIHCDIKPENILLKSNSKIDEIVLIDFGSATNNLLTGNTYVQSRFYRAPEVVQCLPYSNAIDMWSLGCVIIELLTGIPLFPARDSDELLFLINQLLILPVEENYNFDIQFNNVLYSLLSKFVPSNELQNFYNFIIFILMPFPEYRYTSKEALEHVFLKSSEKD